MDSRYTGQVTGWIVDILGRLQDAMVDLPAGYRLNSRYTGQGTGCNGGYPGQVTGWIIDILGRLQDVMVDLLGGLQAG